MPSVNGMGPLPIGARELEDTRPKLQLEDGRLLPMSDMQKLRLDLYNARTQTLQLQAREVSRLMAENDAAQKALLAEVIAADQARQGAAVATREERAAATREERAAATLAEAAPSAEPA